jgi:hypothetical protein
LVGTVVAVDGTADTGFVVGFPVIWGVAGDAEIVGV